MPDPDFQQEDALKKHNLEVTVTEKGQTAEVVETVRETGLEVQITVDAEEDKRAAMRADMRDESKPEPWVRAKDPPQTIATRVQFGCLTNDKGCEGVTENPSSKGTKVLVALQRQRRPSSYGYIRAVEVASKAAIVQTGIFVSKAGARGRHLPGSAAGEVNSAAVMGIADSPSVTGPTTGVLRPVENDGLDRESLTA